MTGGTTRQTIIARNIAFALRIPDALVTCTNCPDKERLVPGVVVVFEVLSPTSGRIDRIVKVREYHAGPTIRRYVILEYTSMGLTVIARTSAEDPWTAITLTAEDTLQMPEIGIEVPVAELYEATDLP
jgi:Uma2 family endonuclease